MADFYSKGFALFMWCGVFETFLQFYSLTGCTVGHRFGAE